MSKRDELIALLQNDTFGLLKDDNRKKEMTSEESALVTSFEEIQNFIEEHGREPISNLSNVIEFKLFSRLKAIRSDAHKVKALKKYDFHGLLIGEEISELDIEDIINDDPFGLLEGDVEKDIFALKHVKPIEIIKPEYLARRKVCKDFEQYKDMFAAIHDELANKKRRFVRYISSDLEIGNFYALSGILLYLKSVDGKVEKITFNSGERERFDGRTECIFDNGTQSDLLFRSLDKAMQIDGYSISELLDSPVNEDQMNEQDILNGYIYILKSMNAKVQHINDLYKIGHTTGTVDNRIKKTKREATYLFDDVSVVSTMRCFNIHSYNLEQRIHDFFSSVKLDIELFDNRGNIYRPHEWFRVNLNAIEDAIKLIINNEIDNFIYDDRIQQIVKR